MRQLWHVNLQKLLQKNSQNFKKECNQLFLSAYIVACILFAKFNATIEACKFANIFTNKSAKFQKRKQTSFSVCIHNCKIFCKDCDMRNMREIMKRVRLIFQQNTGNNIVLYLILFNICGLFIFCLN